MDAQSVFADHGLVTVSLLAERWGMTLKAAEHRLRRLAGQFPEPECRVGGGKGGGFPLWRREAIDLWAENNPDLCRYLQGDPTVKVALTPIPQKRRPRTSAAKATARAVQRSYGPLPRALLAPPIIGYDIPEAADWPEAVSVPTPVLDTVNETLLQAGDEIVRLKTELDLLRTSDVTFDGEPLTLRDDVAYELSRKAHLQGLTVAQLSSSLLAAWANRQRADRQALPPAKAKKVKPVGV